MVYGDEEEIGKVTSARIGMEDHGILTFDIMFDFGGCAQGFGGYNLQCKNSHVVIKAILGAFGVMWWDQLPGRIITVVREGGMIRGLKPLPFEKGKPFNIADMKEPCND